MHPTNIFTTAPRRPSTSSPRSHSSNGTNAPISTSPSHYDILCTGSETVFINKAENLTESRMVYVWLICTALIILGNVIVIVWRCTRRRESRNGIPSILIINLALTDLLLGIDMLLHYLFIRLSCTLLPLPRTDSELSRTLAVICNLVGAFQEMSMTLSGMITATIAFYYTAATFGLCCHCHCSRKIIVIFLAMEWIVAITVGVLVRFPFSDFIGRSFQNQVLSPLWCTMAYDFLLPFSVKHVVSKISLFLCWIISVVILILLVFAALAYICILAKFCRAPASSQAVTVKGLGIRLIIIAFLTLVCWSAFALLMIINNDTAYTALVVLSVGAISNPLVFTIFSKPFCLSVKRLLALTLFKWGRSSDLIQDVLSEDEKAPLLTAVAGDNVSDDIDEDFRSSLSSQNSN